MQRLSAACMAACGLMFVTQGTSLAAAFLITQHPVRVNCLRDSRNRIHPHSLAVPEIVATMGRKRGRVPACIICERSMTVGTRRVDAYHDQGALGSSCRLGTKMMCLCVLLHPPAWTRQKLQASQALLRTIERMANPHWSSGCDPHRVPSIRKAGTACIVHQPASLHIQ